LIPTRNTEMYAQYHWLMYTLAAIAVIILCKGIYDHYKLWRLGQPEDRERWCQVGPGLWRVVKGTLGHFRILRERYPGVMHWMFFWGFAIFALGTLSIAVRDHTGLPTFQGWYYLILSLMLNIFSLLVIIAVIMALWRRIVIKPDRIDNKTEDWISLAFVFFLVVTGLLLSGLRIAFTEDNWALWRPLGYFVSTWFSNIDSSLLKDVHQVAWWVHVCIAMGFAAYMPYSKLFHIITGPVNQYLAKETAAQIIEPIDLEDESIEQFGVAEVQHFTWKHLLDTDACIRCGRCQDNCPAYISGKPLSPKKMIQDLKSHLRVAAAKLDTKQQAKGGEIEEADDLPSLIDEIGEEEVWACTTCGSCEEQCPMFVEHIPKIVELRRNLVMMESSFPSEAQVAFRGMENNGNPWNQGWMTRSDWAKDLDVPEWDDEHPAEYLYWPGCSGAFDSRNRKVAVAMVKLLKKAGVSFAILGNEEKCCGDSARRLGNELLYQTLANENIETLNSHGVKKIITSCPHCFNTLKNEYPQFGGNFEVIHHSVFLSKLLKENKLKPNDATDLTKEIVCTYHDSCYLGRYNGIYDEPREILRSVPGIEHREMARNRYKGFCCGAGGGRMWLEEAAEQRVNIRRTEEALDRGVNLIVTACPFCLIMLEDGTKAKDVNEQVETKDIAEVLWESVN